MRKLATIRIVKEIKPIEGADFIELVLIDGWQCIAKKGAFNQGDKCVYFEIDSFLPIEPQYEFLRKSSFKKMGDKEGFRLKTIKLRGQLSQGLALPLSEIDYDFSLVTEGADLTEILGVVKYEKPIPAQLQGTVKRYFPSFLKKTDQERVQNIEPETIKGHWLATEKLDGTSFTCYLYQGEFGVCSRNLELVESEDNLYWKIARELDLELTLKDGYAIQGEIIGPGVQGNPYKLTKHELYIFHIFDINKQAYLPMYQVPGALDGLKTVPWVDSYVNLEEMSTEEILKYAEGKSILNSETEREGIVFYQEARSFKAISNKFLLK